MKSILILTMALAALVHPLQSHASNYRDNTETTIVSDDLIDQVLQLTPPPTKFKIIPEAQEIRTAFFAKVLAGDYREALNIVFTALKRYPEDFMLQTYLAMLLGDYGGSFSEPYKEQILQKSKELFTLLLPQIDGQSPWNTFYFMNEYCYRFALHKNQYENGAQKVNYYINTDAMDTLGFGGYYCQGVGAANHAKYLLLNNDREQALEYAEKALVAWAQYFSYKNNYYNAYVHYGLALGILGHHEEMLRALKHGAALIQSDLNHHEFKEVLEFIDLIKIDNNQTKN